MEQVISVCNSIISGIGDIIIWVLALLPDSPFQSIVFNLPEFIIPLGWLFPIQEIIATLEAWISCIVLYYCYSAILRWIKVIE